LPHHFIRQNYEAGAKAWFIEPHEPLMMFVPDPIKLMPVLIILEATKHNLSHKL